MYPRKPDAVPARPGPVRLHPLPRVHRPAVPTTGAATNDLAGQTFVGPPTGKTSQEGCEGCGNPGEFEFRADGHVTVTLPGDDLIRDGIWSRTGNDVTVDLEGEKLKLELAGTTLTLHGDGYDLVMTRR